MEDQRTTISNPLAGKSYQFVSAYGMTGRAFYDLRIYSLVEITPDRIMISMKPKKLNKIPAVFLEDITGIDISVKLSPYLIIWTIFTFFMLILSQNLIFLVMSVLFAWLAVNRKITITQRNGIDVILYSRDKEKAIAFQEDMKKIVKIW